MTELQAVILQWLAAGFVFSFGVLFGMLLGRWMEIRRGERRLRQSRILRDAMDRHA